MSPREAVKALVESLLLWLGPAALSRRAFRRRALVLAYHNIVPSGEERGADGSLHLPETAFRAQLDLLEDRARITPLAELLAEPVAEGRYPRVAITFDDAYRGAVTVGLRELARRGHPSTMFVAPGCLGGEGFWWDRIVTPGGGRCPDEFRREALEVGAGETERVLELARARGLREVAPPVHARPATAEELTQAMANPSLVLGAHSWTHPHLPSLAPERLREELAQPLPWLRARFARVAPWLAYPYGASGPYVESALATHGYAAAFLVEGGWLPEASPVAWRLPRLNVPAGLSPRGLGVRVSGLLAA
jgi:peptidoglycan/xylan/chitin deacetylase (PgdA/CDA1 family)